MTIQEYAQETARLAGLSSLDFNVALGSMEAKDIRNLAGRSFDVAEMATEVCDSLSDLEGTSSEQ